MENVRIAVLGMGYVGLPLAIEFSKHFEVIGYDTNYEKVGIIRSGVDPTDEVGEDKLKAALNGRLCVSTTMEDIRHCNVYIVTVPTDINKDKTPNLEPLRNASELIGSVLEHDNLVIYESTTYPGCTEEFCIPLLEKTSGLKLNANFGVGYSPERINPGDKERNVSNILKVTSGSSEETAQKVDALYQTIVKAGTHLAPSIKVAEASKAIENAQRDINISFMNELAMIFDKMEINTKDVLAAAGTKWNFMPFQPGLVGGHCIGVDPYYLAWKAQKLGHNPQVISSGRQINEQMGLFVANSIVKIMQAKDIPIKGSKALILGFAFKENTSDTRNTRVIDVYKELESFGLDVEVFDPLVDMEHARSTYEINMISSIQIEDYQAIVLAVPHSVFLDLDINTNPKIVVYDIKGIWPKDKVDGSL
ncbi:nucleotide sugar dehydrogenase [Bacteroidia bacterium]|nr:nucleotide sugar dehydrogenase [Bacteroidia bacterium]